jgi:hypothetical protein
MTVQFFHVTRSANRAPIRAHGLDWRRMTSWGIANSRAPEAHGIVLCRDRCEATWFAEMGERRGDAIDVWHVVLDYDFDVYRPPPSVPFADSPEGYLVYRHPIPPDRIELCEPEVNS